MADICRTPHSVNRDDICPKVDFECEDGFISHDLGTNILSVGGEGCGYPVPPSDCGVGLSRGTVDETGVVACSDGSVLSGLPGDGSCWMRETASISRQSIRL